MSRVANPPNPGPYNDILALVELVRAPQEVIDRIRELQALEASAHKARDDALAAQEVLREMQDRLNADRAAHAAEKDELERSMASTRAALDARENSVKNKEEESRTAARKWSLESAQLDSEKTEWERQSAAQKSDLKKRKDTIEQREADLARRIQEHETRVMALKKAIAE
jgi:hypothetical protein